MTERTEGCHAMDEPATRRVSNGGPRVQRKITRYWSDRAPAYDAYQVLQADKGPYRQMWSDIWRQALPAPPAEVLDVGCGSGHVALLLPALGYTVTGIDLAEGMLATAREKSVGMVNPPTLRRDDAVAPDFKADSFDAITGRYVMWTLPEPDRALESWRRVLRPGGVLAVVDSTWHSAGFQASKIGEFRRAYDDKVAAALPLAQTTSIDETAMMIEKAGFEDVSLVALHDLRELDYRGGVPDPDDVRLQFLITAHAG